MKFQKRYGKFAAGIILSLGLFGFLFPIIFRSPSTFVVHVDSIPWDSVVIESSNLDNSVTFQSGATEIKLTPIKHGVYRIGINLTNGEAIWAQFFHHDVGVRRIDVTVRPSTNGYHFRETANGSKELFSANAKPAEATKESPFALDWF